MKAKSGPIVICAGLIVVLFLAWPAYPRPFSGMSQGGRQREGVGEDLIGELGLSPQQVEQIKKHRGEDRLKSKVLREKLAVKTSELKEELDKKKIDKKKINNLLAEIEGMMGQQMEQHVEKIISIREILTPEQYEKLKSKLEMKNQQRRQRTEHFKPGGQDEGQRPGGLWQRMWDKGRVSEDQPQ